MRKQTVTLGKDAEGKRVDTILRRELGLSAATVRRAKTQEEGILLDGERVFTTALVHAGQTLSVAIGDTQGSPEIVPVRGELDIRYEDQDLLIVAKPGGMAIHPSPGHYDDTLANLLMGYYEEIGLTAAFHPVNRLDRGTSGLLAVAKHAEAHQRLQRQLHGGGLRRTYLAVCQGNPLPPEGTIDLPIGRAEGEVLRREVREDGAEARTHYVVLDTNCGNGRSLVRLTLDTGRTHQIRVHLAHLGCPLVGDFLYGTECPELPGRFALHSQSIVLRQPFGGEEIRREAEMPEEMRRLLL